MLMEIDPLPMRGSLVMTMAMISPSAQYNGELYAAFGKDESLPKRSLLILSQLVGS